VVDTADGRGDVININLLRESVRVRLELMEANIRVIRDFPVDQIVEIKPGKDIEPEIDVEIKDLKILED
jgi:transcription-repair coupling factor (superfamily II helicase)